RAGVELDELDGRITAVEARDALGRDARRRPRPGVRADRERHDLLGARRIRVARLPSHRGLPGDLVEVLLGPVGCGVVAGLLIEPPRSLADQSLHRGDDLLLRQEGLAARARRLDAAEDTDAAGLR